MKPSDLRIGCFVKLRDSGEIVRVERITRRKCGFFHGNDKSRSYYRRYSEIEGVLIYDHWRKIDCPALNFYDDTNTYYYGGFTLCKGVRYLHELQNLHFALTGEELKIEL